MGMTNALSKMYDLVSGSNDPVLLKAIMEVQQDLIKIQEENRKLRQDVYEFENEKRLKSELKYENNAYFKNGNKKQAFCTNCYDNEGKLITMTWDVHAYSTEFTFACPNCKNTFESKIEHKLDTDYFKDL
ncbi:hypothetical protein DOK76_06885 [Vagococcus sp. DIV0080]|uniref:Uncharacterized protein n=1 Tax=Candidatus Vagococcus giribetii TaxID=2230876 RepID=A0ABS3HSP7_9ENTE|nr:hypothetical protein [Vagococcus sp. DIV0080]MBO0476788.1 hypothetical protein [Vagococcus sp. DIV0080]